VATLTLFGEARLEAALNSQAVVGDRLPSTDGKGALRFLTLGDWGCHVSYRKKDGKKTTVVNKNQQAVKDSILARKYNPNFFIALGDNFYEKGVTSVEDPQFQEAWDDVYTEKPFLKRWYAIVGNHDWRSGVKGIKAQTDFTGRDRHKRWAMNHTYYQKYHRVDDHTKAHFIYLDTTKMIDGDEPQMKWFENALKTSQGHWLFVIGHHPCVSASDHGNIPQMMELVYPLLNKYNVDAYIAGHDHVLEYLKDHNVHYFVIGAGCKLGKMLTEPPQLIYGKAQYGYMHVDVNKDEATFTIVNHLAKTEHEHTIGRRRKGTSKSD
jgi:hypothetical protein